MTDLQQRLRRLADQPELDAHAVLRAARQRDRRRRRVRHRVLVMAAASVLAAVLVALPQAVAILEDRRSTTGEPVATLSTDPGGIAEAMRRSAERSLGVLVEGAPIRLQLLGDNSEKLPAARAAEASAARMELGARDSRHRWRIYVGPASDLPDDPARLCPQRTTTVLPCSARDTADGVVVVSQYVLRRLPDLQLPGGGPAYSVVDDPRLLTPEDLADVRLEKHVSLVRPSGVKTTVVETVDGPPRLEETSFAATEQQLTAVAIDPALRWR
ncbi:hypothetical protein [Nocardioides sp. zg-DK7169]|uniref:hypothetical protein n=1 Tax=Nocardioides sp. zg-DK7169 TaxID=2736600 RepID=UPI0015553C5A|nr:hypothetical protein [Nocardioides sp. zg-DK7169]NPC96855.1 hypothetical protein [Nocardioides sp. zg-DK7169]